MPNQTKVEPVTTVEEAAEPDVSLAAYRTGTGRFIVLLLTLVLLLPFLTKAVTCDDPLFLWVARHIHIRKEAPLSPFLEKIHDPEKARVLKEHILNPYGFDGNWFGDTAPMHLNIQNPPLSSYWLAFAGLAGWDEWWLHLAMLVWPLLAVAGTMRLAGLLKADPVKAGLLTVGTSAFLVSATNLMCDVMLVALMVWSVLLWVEGLEEKGRRKARRIAASALLAAAAGLTKYFGAALVPLLAAYTVFLCPRVKNRLACLSALLFPVIVLAAWEIWTMHLYGMGHMFGAAEYTQKTGAVIFGFDRVYAFLTFLGGCVLWPLVIVLFEGGWIVRMALLVSGALGPLGLWLITAKRTAGAPMLWLLETVNMNRKIISFETYLLSAVFTAAGLATLILVANRLRKRRSDNRVRLSGLWILGVLAFAAFINWTVAARTILLLVPPLAILAATHAPPRKDKGEVRNRHPLPGAASSRKEASAWCSAAVLGVAVAFCAAWSDFAWANSVRGHAREIMHRHGRENQRVLFYGHWGFQYYMQELGAGPAAMAEADSGFFPGDLIVFPKNNYIVPYKSFKKRKEWEILEEKAAEGLPYLCLTDVTGGAGFYGHKVGPLPICVPEEEPDVYAVMRRRHRSEEPGSTMEQDQGREK